MNSFRRPPASQPNAPVTASPKGSAPSADFVELKRRYDSLKERSLALRMEAEHASRAVEECRKKAMKDYGVDSLDALRALAAAQAQKEAEEMARFEAELVSEEQRIAQIEAQLTGLDGLKSW